MSDVLRSEYPRPNLVRQDWQTLNGKWELAFDDEDQGKTLGWHEGQESLPMEITVPFPYQSELSGIGRDEIHNVIWYRRQFRVPDSWEGKRIFLHFGAVDYESEVWVNGVLLGFNRGGFVPFKFDATKALRIGEDNVVVVRVVDTESIDQPRGKQSAKLENWGCWYTRVTGIWQSVWLEPVDEYHIEGITLTTDIDAGQLRVVCDLSGFKENLSLTVKVRDGDEEVATKTQAVESATPRWVDEGVIPNADLTIDVPNAKLWSPESPHLYDLTITLSSDGVEVDRIDTYFGMREISVVDGRVHLNGKPYYHRMVLDQGYWTDGIYTPKDVDAFEVDVQAIKDMGFNGVRKHQKIEDPYFYYYCDRIGLLVWEEMPSPYGFGFEATRTLADEWSRAMRRDINHPSIVAWVPVNESWGFDPLNTTGPERIRAASLLKSLYHLTKSLDPTRLCIGNDGWQHAETDIVTIHEYTQDADDLAQRYQAFEKDPYANTFTHNRVILLPELPRSRYEELPVMITEFGGCKVASEGKEGWGYGEAVADYDEMVDRIASLVDAIKAQERVCGYCYTQLTDVQQEVNGLMTPDRRFKVAPERFREIFGSPKNPSEVES